MEILGVKCNPSKPSVTKDVTKTTLIHCIDININKNKEFCSQLDVRNLWAQAKERKRLDDLKKRYNITGGLGKVEERKIKVKLKADGQYIKFLEKDESGNVITDAVGIQKYCDYVWETIILQGLVLPEEEDGAQDDGTVKPIKLYGKETIRLNISKMSYELQSIFTLSTMRALFQDDMGKGFKDKMYTEQIKLVCEDDAIVIVVEKAFDLNGLDSNTKIDEKDYKAIMNVMLQMMRTSCFRLAPSKEDESKEDEKESKIHNRIIEASVWKDASEFSGKDLTLPNCIYYLAAEPVDGIPTKMYIGEAKSSGGRLCTRTIGGKTYIGHSERPEDFNVHKFCRYRIDLVCSLDAMHDAQDAMIGAFNMADCQLFPDGYVLTNKMLNTAYAIAIREEKAKRTEPAEKK